MNNNLFYKRLAPRLFRLIPEGTRRLPD